MKSKKGLVGSNSSSKITFPIFFALLVILIVLAILFGIASMENKMLKTILITDSGYVEVTGYEADADYYYTQASLSYEYNEFNDVVDNCEIARGYYFDATQEQRRLKAKLKDAGIEHKLINLYISILDEGIEINNNMYEACEYFESASRQYDYYDYWDGDINIDLMGDKIRDRDKAVERYNDYLAEYNLEMEKLIE